VSHQPALINAADNIYTLSKGKAERLHPSAETEYASEAPTVPRREATSGFR
jgi:ATP-binding cassette subfamily C protein